MDQQQQQQPLTGSGSSRPAQLMTLPLLNSGANSFISDSTTVLTPRHISRHFILSPSSTSGDQLLSPSGGTTSFFGGLSVQQQEMSFTSAFSSSSSLRHRRGKTLILPKLKIAKGQGYPEAQEESSTTSSIFSSTNSSSMTIQQHFRRSVSTSTFAESSWYASRRQSSTSTVSDFLGASWVFYTFYRDLDLFAF